MLLGQSKQASYSRYASIGVSLWLAGCSILPSVGPDYAVPKIEMPSAWLSESTNSTEINAAGLWWKDFGDEELNNLVDSALKNNKDLLLAVSRVKESQARRKIASAEFYPTLESAGSFSRSARDPQNASGLGFSEVGDRFLAGLQSSWEIDIFGGNRRGLEAAQAEFQASAEGVRAAQLSLVAEVVSTFIEMRSFQKRIILAKNNLALQSDSLGIVDSRFKAGLTNELDLVQAKAQLENTRSLVPLLEAEAKRSEYSLARLIGEQPGGLAAQVKPLETEEQDEIVLPSLPSTLSVGIPSELLRNRPDVLQAERSLAAATARVGVAVSDLFPRFTLSGGYGYRTSQFGSLFEANSSYWHFVPGVEWPVFEGGKISANIELHDEQEKQALLRYEDVVLKALQETETLLTALKREGERSAALKDAFLASKRAQELAKDLYSQGLVDFLRVLDTERSSFAAEDTWVQSETKIVLNQVALQKALGVVGSSKN